MALANSFARRQLEKHGWHQGKGLGKGEDGISEAVKVDIKQDTTGVGHDPGKEFSFHWWEHLYDKAANNIIIQNNNKGKIRMSTKSSKGDKGSKEGSSQDRRKLYSHFVKPGEKNVDNDVENPYNVLKNSANLKEISNPDKVFLACGARTAHKAARHGHKLSGKLQRLQRQEETLSLGQSNTTNEIVVAKTNRKRKTKSLSNSNKDKHKMKKPKDLKDSKKRKKRRHKDKKL